MIVNFGELDWGILKTCIFTKISARQRKYNLLSKQVPICPIGKFVFLCKDILKYLFLTYYNIRLIVNCQLLSQINEPSKTRTSDWKSKYLRSFHLLLWGHIIRNFQIKQFKHSAARAWIIKSVVDCYPELKHLGSVLNSDSDWWKKNTSYLFKFTWKQFTKMSLQHLPNGQVYVPGRRMSSYSVDSQVYHYYIYSIRILFIKHSNLVINLDFRSWFLQ